MPFLNNHVYSAIADNDLKLPDIPVFAAESFGQCAEDLIVAAMLDAMANRHGLDLTQERYLEIGANHPVSCSATYLLHRRFEMHGVLVEANAALIGDLKRCRPYDKVLHLAITSGDEPVVPFHVSNQDELSSLDRKFVEEWRGGSVGLRETHMVPALSINRLLEQEFSSSAPLFLSIDIEGLDLPVLRTLDFGRWRPAIIQTEPSEHFAPGNTAALAAWLHASSYIVIARTPVNLIAVDVAQYH